MGCPQEVFNDIKDRAIWRRPLHTLAKLYGSSVKALVSFDLRKLSWRTWH
jgi:hypothetical protein